MMKPGAIAVSLVAIACLLAGPAQADDAVSAAVSAGVLVITVGAEAANVHFGYVEKGCDAEVPCIEIDASQGMLGVPVTAGGGCQAQPGGDSTPSLIRCKAAPITAVTFRFMKGGSWSSYAGNGGEHAGGPCAPMPVAVQTGPDGGAITVNTWNGCQETVICDSPATMMTGVEADAADTVRGACVSVVRH